MFVSPEIQADFERNLIWKSFWPRCVLALIAIIEIFLGVAIFFTEIFNILLDFWHTNVFGGIWASLILFINWILIFVTVCCKTTFRASMCSLLWHLLTIVAFCVLIGFDILFIIDPYTCFLTKNCSQQSQTVSLNSAVRNHLQIANYTTEDPKRYFLRIQLFCAVLVLILAMFYVAIFNLCRFRYRQVMSKMCSSKEEKTCPSVQDATLVWSTTSDFAPFTSSNPKSNLAFVPDKN